MWRRHGGLAESVSSLSLRHGLAVRVRRLGVRRPAPNPPAKSSFELKCVRSGWSPGRTRPPLPEY
eukprot:671811-Rhodomonas_salina.1